jgi:hypothetical protein
MHYQGRKKMRRQKRLENKPATQKKESLGGRYEI